MSSIDGAISTVIAWGILLASGLSGSASEGSLFADGRKSISLMACSKAFGSWMAVDIMLSVVTVLPIGDVVFPFPVQPATWRLRASMGASVILASSRCSSSFSFAAS